MSKFTHMRVISQENRGYYLTNLLYNKEVKINNGAGINIA